MDIKKLYEDRTKVWEDQKAINDKAHTEKRTLTAEEQTAWDKADTDFADISKKITDAEADEKREIDRAQKMEAREREMKATPIPTKINPDPDGGDKKEERDKKDKVEVRTAWKNFLSRTDASHSLPDTELRALQADSAVVGGFLVAPEFFRTELIKDLEDMVFVRKYAKVIPLTNAESLTAPELANRIGDPTWTAELKIGNEDSTMSFEKRQFTPHPLARYIKVSKKLLRIAAIDVVAEIRSGLAYEFATVEENAYLNGTGANQPLGVMTAHAAGISTARDVSAGNTVSAITADNLWNNVYSLKAQYRNGCRWIFHRNAIKMVRKLKDGEGNYIWAPGLVTAPPTICGFPYDESEYMPSAFSTGKYVGLLGNWKYYWIVEALNLDIQVLLELFAVTNQNAYVGRRELDGGPVHENAFSRVTQDNGGKK